nr:MAG: transporter [Lokiarchaeota virus Skoll Meg22_1214]
MTNKNLNGVVVGYCPECGEPIHAECLDLVFREDGEFFTIWCPGCQTELEFQIHIR